MTEKLPKRTRPKRGTDVGPTLRRADAVSGMTVRVMVRYRMGQHARVIHVGDSNALVQFDDGFQQLLPFENLQVVTDAITPEILAARKKAYNEYCAERRRSLAAFDSREKLRKEKEEEQKRLAAEADEFLNGRRDALWNI